MYNEEWAQIEYPLVGEKKQIETALKQGRMEKLIKHGDRGLVTKKKNQIAFFWLFFALFEKKGEENGNFIAHMHPKLLTERMQEKGKLTALEFAYVPLKDSLQLQTRQNQQITWKMLLLFKHTWRPVAIGCLEQEHDTQSYQWWRNPESTNQKELTKFKTVFAAWPVQAYVEDFSQSIAMMLTLENEETWLPREWLQSKPISSNSH